MLKYQTLYGILTDLDSYSDEAVKKIIDDILPQLLNGVDPKKFHTYANEDFFIYEIIVFVDLNWYLWISGMTERRSLNCETYIRMLPLFAKSWTSDSMKTESLCFVKCPII